MDGLSINERGVTKVTTVTYEPLISVNDDERYHADKSHWSRSLITEFLRDRRKVEAILHGIAEPEKNTDYLDMGSAAHAALFEPRLFQQKFAIATPADLSKSGSRAGNNWKDFKARNNGRTCLIPKQAASIAMMAASVATKIEPIVGRPGLQRIYEEPIYWEDEETNMLLKAKPDYLAMPAGAAKPVPLMFLFDLKTTADSSPQAFRRSARKWRYDIQQVQYCEALYEAYGAREVEFFFVVVEREVPFSCNLYQLSDETVLAAEEDWREGLRQIAGCLESGDWSNPWEHEVTEISLL